METLKENIIIVEYIKEEIEKAEFEVTREDEDFDNCYDWLHEEWAAKGLKAYSDELKKSLLTKNILRGG